MSKMIAVTMGDPAGIGPEIIIKSLAEGALSGAPVVVVGCALAKSRPRQGISRFAASGGRPRWRWRARSRPSLPRR